MPKANPIKRVVTSRGVRYMRGGKFISAAAVKRSRAAKRRRNPRSGGGVYTTPSEVRSFTAQKTRRTKARKTGGTLKTRKVTRFRSRKKTGTRKKTTTAKRRATTKRRTPMAKSRKRSLAAKKGWRRRRAAGTATTRRRKKKTTRRKTTAKRRKTAKRKTITVTVKANPRRRRRRRNSTVVFRSFKRMGKKRRSYSKARVRVAGRKTKYRIRRTRRGARLVRKNPVAAMKSALKSGAMFWAGLTGMKVLNGLIKTHVVEKFGKSLPAQLLPILPSALGFVAATALLPKVIKGKAQLLNALQMGATVALIDAAFNAFVLKSLPASVQTMLSGFGGFGAFHPTVPVSEYVDYDNRMGDYVGDNRYGVDVQEALAADEVNFMQRGGAGGVFQSTVFGS